MAAKVLVRGRLAPQFVTSPYCAQVAETEKSGKCLKNMPGTMAQQQVVTTGN
jgi:hypothetical protein